MTDSGATDYLVALEDDRDIVFWPKHEIASFTPEFRNRWRVVRNDGSVGNRPTPPPAGPWVQLGDSWVNPRYLQPVSGGGWNDPAGFPQPAGELPAPPPLPSPTPSFPKLPCPPDQILAVIAHGNRHCLWLTDIGQYEAKLPASQAAARHPHMVMLGAGRFVNLRRVRRLRRHVTNKSRYFIVLDDGSEWFKSHGELANFLQALGLSSPAHLQPFDPLMYRHAKRDYPYILGSASEERLRMDFSESLVLIANVIWQVFRYRRLGKPFDYGQTLRDFWYRPLETVLYRAGFLDPSLPEIKNELFEQFTYVVGQYVDDGLFNYSELGFKPSYTSWVVGNKRPELVLVAEKHSLGDLAAQLAEEFGVSYVCTEGFPSHLVFEYLSADLAAATTQKLRILAQVDWDPGGYWIAQTAKSHFRRYGVEVEETVEYVVRPECFSAEEIALYSVACPTRPKNVAEKARNWVKTTGGIGGVARGIHANHLPPERVRARVEGLLRD